MGNLGVKQELLKIFFSLFDDMTLQRLLVMGMGVYLEKMEKKTSKWGFANMSHIQTTQFTRKKKKKIVSKVGYNIADM